MILVFSIFKYKEWLRLKQKLDNVSIENILYLNNMDKFHGISRDRLWSEGHIILDEWCDEVQECQEK